MDEAAAVAMLADGAVRCAADVPNASTWQGGGPPPAMAAGNRAADERAAGFESPPVYGYLTTAHAVEPGSSGIAGYGPVRVLLRESVNDRATVTQGDFRAPFGTRPGPLNQPTFGCSIPMDTPLLRRTIVPLPEDDIDTYWEAHIHGGPIPLTDIERIDVIGDTDAPDVLAAAASARTPRCSQHRPRSRPPTHGTHAQR